MRYLLRTVAMASWLAVPTVASAVSLSGIVLYSAYDSGDPNGYNSYDNNQPQAQLWRTGLGGEYYGLGVWSGLPPQSLAAPPLNTPDFRVEIPLAEGENDFTLLGQPGPDTRNDQTYSEYALHLYFDDVLDHPGISVIFPRTNVPSGSPTSPSRSDRIYSLDLNQVKFSPQATYDDGVDTVSVLAASFLPPEVFGKDVDLVSAHSLAPSGAENFIGVLKIMVEASENGAQALAPAAQAPGIVQGIADSGTIHGPEIPIAGARPGLVEPEQGGDRGAASAGAHPGSGAALASGETEPTAAVDSTGSPGGTPSPAKTPSPNATGGSPTVSAGGATSTPAVTGSAAVTRTPPATGTTSTPAPRTSTTALAATPAAGSRSK